MPHSDHSPSPSPSGPFANLPPFPSNIPTAPLLRISLSKLLSQDPTEQTRCFAACQSLGFFYLSLDGVQGEELQTSSSALFTLMPSFFNLPVAEKMKYDFKDRGSYFGYKGFGEGYVDAEGGRDRNEFYNSSKDDVLGVGVGVGVGVGGEEEAGGRLPVPGVLAGREERALLGGFIQQSHAVCEVVLGVLEERLRFSEEVKSISSTAGGDGAGAGVLKSRHRLHAVSGDQVRFVRAPPQDESVKGVSLGEHTDFGSVTVLFNGVGGLQVRLPPGMEPEGPASSGDDYDDDDDDDNAMSDKEKALCQDGWCYVRPLPGHCIINLGDAVVKFSAGALRSNIHRVVAPPGEQGAVTRWSLVYFSRPEDDVILKSLVEAEKGESGGETVEEEVTAKEWILRRALGRRDPKGWERSAGTEESSMRKGGMRV